MPEDRKQSDEARRYINEKLGPWSSHPEKMADQKRRLTRLGLIPFFVGLVWVVLVLTSYRTSDFAGVCDWGTFVTACGVLWGKVRLSAYELTLLGCVTLGFTLTLNLLWLVGMTLERRETGEFNDKDNKRSVAGEKEAEATRRIVERDKMPFPWSVMIVFAFFWLVPAGLWGGRKLFTALDWRLNLVLQVVSNLLCVAPLAALLAWMRWAGRRAPGPDEELRHSVGHLLSALALLAGSVVVLALPCPGFFEHLLTSRFMWVLRCGIAADTAFKWVKHALSAFLALWGAFHLLLWRWKTEIRPKGKKSEQQKPEDGDESKKKREEREKAIPAGAQYLLKNMPSSVTVVPGPDGASVYKQPVVGTSEEADKVEYGLNYLMGGDKIPTEDQAKFFNRYVEAFQAARSEFAKRTKFVDGENRPDMLLLGEDGAGRTEIMLAAALYAVVVRGQRALYLCVDATDCDRLAKQASARLERLGVDVYLSAGVLGDLQVDAWLDPNLRTPLPDLLFSTPEDAERAFFANPATKNLENAKVVKEALTGFGAVFVDDFLELSMSRRSHTAFLIDKLKLLQAADAVFGQYVVAADHLYVPDGEEALGSRLFGKEGFDREHNVKKLKPRPYNEYWFGTLCVARGKKDSEGKEVTLESVERELAEILGKKGYCTLFYQKGMSEEAKKEFLDHITAEARGKVQVASHYRELEELTAKPDNVFYLSLASGEAGVALRLNLGEGDPVFFRIVLAGEPNAEPPVQYGLLPDETAMTLRVHHLRNVLQFIDQNVPIPDEVWGRFQIKMDHRGIRELVPGYNPDSVTVSWFHDLLRDKAYSQEELGSYLILEAAAAHLAVGGVNFNCLPTDSGSIWKSVGDEGRLLLAETDDGTTQHHSHLALWKSENDDLIGEWDLSHDDNLVFSERDEWVPSWIDSVSNEEKRRYAVRIIAHYRHGYETEFIHPVRHLKWNVRRGNLVVKAFCQRTESLLFQVEQTVSPTCLIEGNLRSLANSRGETNSDERRRNSSRNYSYEAYLSCWVLMPMSEDLFDGGTVYEEDSDENRAARCLDGIWQTTRESGYSCALTHSLAAAFKRKIADWSFFAVTPVFWTDCRSDSIGRATIWFVESGNSGRVAQPLIRNQVMDNQDFRESLYRTALETLEKYDTLEDLRMASGFAFAEESLDNDDRQEALALLKALLDKESADRWKNKKREEREEARKKRREQGRPNRTVEQTPEEKEFNAVVTTALRNFENSIDVSKFAAEYGWNTEKLCDLYNDVLWNNPEIFWIAKSCRYQYWEGSDGKITRFFFIDLYYAFKPEELDNKQKELDTAIAEAMAKVRDAADDATKALQLHDYIVGNCEYDMEAKNRNDQSPLARTAYSALVRGKAVCEGYAMAYRYLLSRVGIESEEVISDSMNHCWNYVRLGENWYHVDVTWDDPVYQGRKPSDDRISHKFFLLSDEAIRAKEHHDWDVRGLPPATDTTYDKRDWDDDINPLERERQEREREERARQERERQEHEQEEREREEREQEERVPWKEYKNHFLFKMKGRGNVKKCCGKVHLRVFFVDDGNSAWDDSSRATYREIVDGVSKRLEREGNASGVAIKVSWSTENRSISQSIQKDHVRQDALGKSRRSRKKDPDDWLYEALGVADDAAVAAEQNDFKRANSYDEAPIIFVFNKDFRSTARCSESPSRRACEEWTMISLEDNLYDNPDRVRKVLLHELLHLFGAEDLYYHPTIEEAAEKFLPDSIMNDGDSIDDLTRVLIGWEETLSSNAVAFLNAIKGVSSKEFDDAHTKALKEKWHQSS